MLITTGSFFTTKLIMLPRKLVNLVNFWILVLHRCVLGWLSVCSVDVDPRRNGHKDRTTVREK